VDTRPTLEAIAGTLPGLPQDAVESTLLTFDTLVHFGDQGTRPEAALFLRNAAQSCDDPDRRQRLLRAADSVTAEEPIALTPDGLTWQQAAAAQTITADKWVEPPEPVYAELVYEEEDEEEDEPEDEDELAELAELAALEDEDDEDDDE
jgi:hypothetical protein